MKSKIVWYIEWFCTDPVAWQWLLYSPVRWWRRMHPHPVSMSIAAEIVYLIPDISQYLCVPKSMVDDQSGSS